MDNGPSMIEVTNLGGKGDLPKCEVTPYAYLVKWVTRGRGQKSQKRGDIICVRPPSAEFTLCRIIIFWILLCKDLLLV